MKSYTDQRSSLSAFVRETHRLFVQKSAETSPRVKSVITELQWLEQYIEAKCERPFRDFDILDVGPGQFPYQMIYFAQRNRVVGIDLDIVVQTFSPTQYLKMLRCNGIRRTVKTLGRKLLGIDRAYASEMKRQLETTSFPKLVIYQMDACKMTFPDESFDLVHSRTVFQHLPDPSLGLAQLVRVLKPGGMACVGLHLYTSETGSLDYRSCPGHPNQLPLWSHLRPDLESSVQSPVFLNKLRLQEWETLFAKYMPDSELILTRNPRSNAIANAQKLIKSGELGNYSIDELLTDGILVLWRKPLKPTLC
ncbi:MAG: class I SAM-dependent methyltransferase [Verrucomicrobiota bacterium]